MFQVFGAIELEYRLDDAETQRRRHEEQRAAREGINGPHPHRRNVTDSPPRRRPRQPLPQQLPLQRPTNGQREGEDEEDDEWETWVEE